MVVQAIVVVEETVSDEDGGCRIFNPDVNDLGPDLGPERSRPTQPDHQSAQQAVQRKFEALINLQGISPEAGKFVANRIWCGAVQRYISRCSPALSPPRVT
jgi:hypothetical protein